MEITGVRGLTVDFAKDPKELPTRACALARPHRPQDAVDEPETHPEGRQSRTSRCVTGTVRARFPAHIRGAATRDFEEVSQSADFPIATLPQLLGSVRGLNANPRRF